MGVLVTNKGRGGGSYSSSSSGVVAVVMGGEGREGVMGHGAGRGREECWRCEGNLRAPPYALVKYIIITYVDTGASATRRGEGRRGVHRCRGEGRGEEEGNVKGRARVRIQ